MFEVELGPLTGLSQDLTYNVHLAWTQASGSDSGLLAMHSLYAPSASCTFAAQAYDGTVFKIPQDSTSYRISVPIYNLGDGPLLVNLTINLYCISTTNVYLSAFAGYICACSQWQVRWLSNSLQISAKRG